MVLDFLGLNLILAGLVLSPSTITTTLLAWVGLGGGNLGGLKP